MKEEWCCDACLLVVQLKKVPDYHGSSFNPEEVGNNDIEPSPERAQHHEHYASLWNKVCVPCQ